LFIAMPLTIANQPVLASQGASAAQAAHCELSFQASDQSWKGQCGPIFGNEQVTPLTARKVTSLPGGSGRSGATPTLMLVGEVSTQYGTWDLEFEFYGRDGAIRTPAAWRPVNLTNGLTETTLRFRVAEESEVDSNNLDRRISDQIVTDRVINELMGKDSSARFKFIMERAEEAEDVDV
jgi:hypothetical protein